MNTVYSYEMADGSTIIYFRDGEVRLITDLGSAETVELGIEASGVDLVSIESGLIDEADINVEVITLEQEQLIGKRISDWIAANE